jgi:hypothetical protein
VATKAGIIRIFKMTFKAFHIPFTPYVYSLWFCGTEYQLLRK